MSFTKKLTFSGKCKWAHVYAPNKYSKYSVVFYPNASDLEKIKELKLKNSIKEDEDGTFITWSRPTKKTIKGKEVSFGPPLITDQNNYVVSDQIGNGSDVTVTIDYYGYRKPFAPPGTPLEYAARLEGIRIDHLVPYDAASITDERMLKAAEALGAAPPQVAGWR